MLAITRKKIITSEWWAEVVHHTFSLQQERSEMLIVILAKHGYTQNSHGYGCVCGLHIMHTLITSPFFNFWFDLENTFVYSGYSHIECYCGTDPRMPACWHSNLYQLHVVVQSSSPLFSDFTRNPLHLTAQKAEKLVKYSAWSELFSMMDQMKDVVDWFLL